ncbi:MAG TPA: PadR family transcriptional regulator, partial [Cytophagales bacterium]|nr:PadR family transcriptional regulator [Cytophagales bacterium]
GALQSALSRLEDKGFLQSREGAPAPNRAGRPKRFFTITSAGQTALENARAMRQGLWEAIPAVAFPNKS